MAIWHTSVNELFKNLQGALKAIAPWVNLSKISYSEQESYDDWDKIAESLYRAIVVSSIAHSQDFESQKKFPNYDIHYDNYRDFNFIILEQTDDRKHYTVFVSFSGSAQFDLVNYCKVDVHTLQVVERGQVDFGNSNFFLVINGRFWETKELVVVV